MIKINSKHIINTLAVAIIGIIGFSCEEPPELSETPRIEFNSVRFVAGANFEDSLILRIDFEDGNGDLGLDDDDRFNPRYQEFYFVSKSGSLLENFIESEVVFFGEPNQPPYNIDDWYAQADYTGDEVIDTIRVEYNENFFNIFVDFFYRADVNGDGDDDDDEDYIRMNLDELLGLDYNGRFMMLNLSDNERPLRGTLTYNMTSFFRLNPIFNNRTLKLDVQIQDRELNRSNIISTTDFVME